MTTPDQSTPSSIVTPKRVAAVVLIALAVAFIAQNTARSTITLLWLHVEWPMWLALAIIFVLGLASGFLVGRSRTKRKYTR